MRFDVYGQFVLEAVQSDAGWTFYYLSEGKRRRADVEVPPDAATSELAGWLDDHFHEQARPGDRVRELPGSSPPARERWSPAQYLKFEREREQPFHDLLALVEPREGMEIVDLGCGTGRLTAHLHRTLKARRT